MVMTDTIGDMLARIRNGGMAKKAFVKCPASSERKSILEVLKNEGFITSYSSEEIRKGVSELTIVLKYYKGENVIKKLERISKPGRRVYTESKDIPSVYNGLGVSIISTPAGVLSDKQAREKNVGGEIICKIF
ncbi:MAG: 30S ribosomal protein S8 [Rickettsiales bacterium]|jgi:small subunit ribosomal protein S8|nr:30S ribosomal protein S8 [Rickettsiales bacterium]